MNKLESKKFRDAFVASNARRGIAYQLRAMRGNRTQGQIGKLAGKPQNVISRLENPRYGKANIQTLIELASVYDVALLVKFVPFGRLIAETEDLSQNALVPLSFDAEMALKRAVKSGDIQTPRSFTFWGSTSDDWRSVTRDEVNPPSNVTDTGTKWEKVDG